MVHPVIARLDERVDLQRLTYTRDAAGDELPSSWATYATVWASVVAVGGSESVEDDQRVSRGTYQVEIRRRSDLRPTDRILWRGLALEVSTIGGGTEREASWRSLNMVLTCTETKG